MGNSCCSNTCCTSNQEIRLQQSIKENQTINEQEKCQIKEKFIIAIVKSEGDCVEENQMQQDCSNHSSDSESELEDRCNQKSSITGTTNVHQLSQRVNFGQNENTFKNEEKVQSPQLLQVESSNQLNILKEVKRKNQSSLTFFSSEVKRSTVKKNTIGSINTMRLGVDIFVNLRKGSIHKYYTQDTVLGQGAYGKVWKVKHKTTGLIRAMKEMKKKALIKEEQKKLFAEMNILKNLDHPHIVKLYELYQDDENYYMITEYLSGGELFERIKKMTCFSEKKASEYMRQILSAILYCHDQQIVHRDIKPENILFCSNQPNARLKIIDFGTSRKFTVNVNMTQKLGTPYYIAPEVIQQDYNEKCDVWSCGIILYVLLCGYPPFQGRTEQEIMEKVKTGIFEFDPDDWSLISKDAKNLIQKMLALNPSERFSARQALNDPWMQKYAPNELINQKVLMNLQQFQAKSFFQQAIITYIASQMTSQNEIEELSKTFALLDTNNDGMLCRDELIQGYQKIYNDQSKAEEEVDKILDIIDLNQSGKVDFTEFLMAAMNKDKLLTQEKVIQAFQILDENNDGLISKQELSEAMGQIDEELWQSILQECGNQNKDHINKEEFLNILMQQI